MIFIRVHLKIIIRQFHLQVIPQLCCTFAVSCYTIGKEFLTTTNINVVVADPGAKV